MPRWEGSKGVPKRRNPSTGLGANDAISPNTDGFGVGKSTYRAYGIISESTPNIKHAMMLKESPIPPIPKAQFRLLWEKRVAVS